MKSSSSSSPAKTFEKLMFNTKDGVCVTANSLAELKKLFNSSGAHNIITQQILNLPLQTPLSETATVLSCCHEDVEKVRQLIGKFSDMKILILNCIADEIQDLVKQKDQQQQEDQKQQQQQQADQKSSSSSSPATANKSIPQQQESGKRRTRLGTSSATAASSSTSGSSSSLSGDAAEKQKLVTFYANVIGLLYGLVFPASKSQPVACAALVDEKQIVEESDQYASSNAAERRKAMQNSVLCVFSDRGQRFYFSRVWTNVLQEVLSYRMSLFAISSSSSSSSPSNSAAATRTKIVANDAFSTSMHILSLHLLTDVNNSIIPWLTNPLLLSETLTEAYRDGGLLAVLALEGLLTLIVSHGLEYPKFYTGLYALVTSDIFSSPHRNRFFRLLHLALTSVRVASSIAASFIKRLARCALICPSPALYFVLPFIRQKLQQHKNCFNLIHRSLRDVDEEEADIEKQKKKMTFASSSSSNNKKDKKHLEDQIERVERLKKLFEGVDSFDPKETDPEKTNALDSTLWEIAALEKHYLPAARNAVAAFASPAEDNQHLQFERSYARLFAHSMSMTETQGSGCTVAPPPGSRKTSFFATAEEEAQQEMQEKNSTAKASDDVSSSKKKVFFGL